MDQKNVEKAFKKYADKISAKADKRMERLSAEAEERTQLYVQAAEARFSEKLDVVKDELNAKIDAVLEIVEEIPEIKRKVDLTFEKVGEIAVDVEVIKETVKDHPSSPKASAGQSEVRIQLLQEF